MKFWGVVPLGMRTVATLARVAATMGATLLGRSPKPRFSSQKRKIGNAEVEILLKSKRDFDRRIP